MRKSTLARKLMRSTVLTGAAAAFAVPAFAQNTDDEIVVTGSRIAREDLAAPSPVQSVSSEQLVLTNTVNTEEFLDALPQVIPSFDSSSNNPGNGTAQVNLRGLGTNRTLVLVDGLRFVGSGAGAAVDLNNIPSALVKRLEVVTGGQSAVYGSDAIAGVVNFVLKDDFEGFQFDVSDRLSASGWDANTLNAAITMGGNFADGRGNAVLAVSYTNREALFQGDRKFSEFTFFDPGAGSTSVGFIPGGSSSVPGTRFRGRTSTNFSTGNGSSVDPACATNTCLGFFVPSPGTVAGLRFGNPNDLYNYAPTNYLQLPQERYSIFGRASYEINDSVEVYARGLFAGNVVDSQLAPTPAGFTVAAPIATVQALNPALAAIMANDPNTNNCNGANPAAIPHAGAGAFCFRFNKRFEELGTRNSLRDTNTYQFAGGVKVDVADGWVWNTDAQFGRSSISQIQTGNVSVSALREAIWNGADIYNGPGSLSAADAAAITRTGAIIDIVEQTQIVSALSGTIGQLKSPMAQQGVGLAVGVEYREEFAESIPDSVLGPDVLGFNQSLPVGGRFDVYEAFMETDIPIFEDTAIGDFSINGAYRFSSYSLANVDTTHTYAVGGSWKPIDGLRFRAQFQHAVRAPNIGELFSPLTNGFPGAQDPCSTGTFGSFNNPIAAGLFGAVIPATCTATGVPLANVGTAFQSNGQIEVLSGGEPNLFEESADTLTIGMVWQPSFVEGLTVQVDYYDVDIEDAIGAPSLQFVLDACHRQNSAEACAIITRDTTTGEITSPFIPNIVTRNFSNLGARGIDGQIDYTLDIGNMGTVTFNYYGSFALRNEFLPFPGLPLIDCVGFYAGLCGEPTPEYKHTMQATWNYGAVTASTRWRYIGALDVFPTEQVSILSDDIGAYNYLDVTLKYAVNENLDLTVGVQNITGKDAPVLGSTVSEQANTFPATYDTLGRQLFFGASLKF